MAEVFCNFALRNTKNQNRINGSGFVSLSWLSFAVLNSIYKFSTITAAALSEDRADVSILSDFTKGIE